MIIYAALRLAHCVSRFQVARYLADASWFAQKITFVFTDAFQIFGVSKIDQTDA